MRITFLRSPFHGSSGSNLKLAYKNIGHWSPAIVTCPLLSFSLILSPLQLARVSSLKYAQEPTQHWPSPYLLGTIGHPYARG